MLMSTNSVISAASLGRVGLIPLGNLTMLMRTTRSLSDYSSDEYQLLHKCIIPTYHFQKSLRRLPIPKLPDSCQRFLNAVRAIYDKDGSEMKKMESLVDQFLKEEGPELQKALLQYDREHRDTSYISEPWFDMYLSARVPCPVNYNPFMMFAADPEPAYNDQLIRATNFVISCARFKRALDAEVLAPEVFHLNPEKSDTKFFRTFCSLLPPSVSWFGAVIFKAFPLDMSQYSSLFGGCRIPQRGKDRLHLRTDSRHFIAVNKGHFYTVELFDQNDQIYAPEHVHASLSKILQDSPKDGAGVGSLTTLDRDSWADIRNELISASKQNLDSLTAIEDALFLLCLDDLRSTEPGRLLKSLLCGDDGRNRWFDKCFQLIVDGNGQATINFEHSWGDGVAVLRLMEESLKDTIKHRFVSAGQKPSQSALTHKLVRKLDWQLTDSLRSHIKKAQEEHVEICQKLDFGVLEHKDLTKQTIKEAKLSPDAIMQLGIQMAFYDVYREFVPTYESCSTAAFLKGRTECIRSATIATKETVLAFESGQDNGKLFGLLQKCSDTHSLLVKEASLGQGFDRHLFGLRHTAKRLGRSQHPLFSHSVFNQMNHFVLSTSTLSTDTIYFGGFGPVVPDGFGVGYSVTDTRLGAAVTAYKGKRDATKFCEALDRSLKKVLTIILANGSKETKTK